MSFLSLDHLNQFKEQNFIKKSVSCPFKNPSFVLKAMAYLEKFGLSLISDASFAQIVFGLIEGFIIDVVIALYFLFYPQQFIQLWVPAKALKASPFSQPASCALVKLFCLALLGLGMLQIQVFRLGSTELCDSVMIPLAIGDLLHIFIVLQFYSQYDAKLSTYLFNIVPTGVLLVFRFVYYFRI